MGIAYDNSQNVGPAGPTGATGPAGPSTSVQTYSPVWTGTGLAFTGTPATGEYIQFGKYIFFNIKVLFSTVTNFGTGQYSLTLPFAPDNNYFFRNSSIHQGSTHYSIAADAAPGTTSVVLYHTANTNGSSSYAYDDLLTGTNPVTLTTSGYMYISGQYLVP